MSEMTRIQRLPERAVEDKETIYSILDEGLVCHVAYVTDGRPVVIPTLYARDGDQLILHGSTTSGFVRAVRAGSPLSIAVTHLDGIVVARSGFHSSANYRSVVIHGSGRILEGEEHETALDSVVEALIPGRLNDIRPPTETELKQTAAISVPLDEMSAKVRTGGPHDDPEDMGSDVWAGVVPLQVTAGEASPADDLAPGIETPDYLEPYRR